MRSKNEFAFELSTVERDGSAEDASSSRNQTHGELSTTRCYNSLADACSHKGCLIALFYFIENHVDDHSPQRLIFTHTGKHFTFLGTFFPDYSVKKENCGFTLNDEYQK